MGFAVFIQNVNNMLGGGFLRQMNETIKYNRDLLGKTKRTPFERSDRKISGHKILSDHGQMSDDERVKFLDAIKDRNRRAILKSLIILMISVLATALLVCTAKWIWF